MIFVTTGSAPFPRLVSMVEGVAGETDNEFFVQTADKDVETELEYVDYLDMNEFQSVVDEATLLIGHAGIGTILTSIKMKTPIIVIPRRAKYGEHGDDHQVATAERFESKNLVAVARSEEELLSIIDSGDYPTHYSTENSLSNYIERRIRGL